MFYLFSLKARVYSLLDKYLAVEVLFYGVCICSALGDNSKIFPTGHVNLYSHYVCVTVPAFLLKSYIVSA